MNVRASALAATLTALALTGVVAVQAQDASPGAAASPMPVASAAASAPAAAAASPAAEASSAASPAALASPAAASPAAEGSPAASAGDGPHPAHIHTGACPDPGDVVAPLSDVIQPTVEMVGEGADQVPLEVSTTKVDMALQDILAEPHAINVHQSADAMDVYIACGDIGSQLTGEDSVAIVLTEQNSSGHTGFAWLTDQGDGTTRVDIILTRVMETGVNGAGASASPSAAMSPAAASPAAGASSAAASPAAGASSAAASPAAGASMAAGASSAAPMSPAAEASPAAS
jgi:hypothetical protein